MLITTAADDSPIFFFFFFFCIFRVIAKLLITVNCGQINKTWHFKQILETIHMKWRLIFNGEKIKTRMSSATFLLSALRVKRLYIYRFGCTMSHNNSDGSVQPGCAV